MFAAPSSLSVTQLSLRMLCKIVYEINSLGNVKQQDIHARDHLLKSAQTYWNCQRCPLKFIVYSNFSILYYIFTFLYPLSLSIHRHKHCTQSSGTTERAEQTVLAALSARNTKTYILLSLNVRQLWGHSLKEMRPAKFIAKCNDIKFVFSNTQMFNITV